MPRPPLPHPRPRPMQPQHRAAIPVRAQSSATQPAPPAPRARRTRRGGEKPRPSLHHQQLSPNAAAAEIAGLGFVEKGTGKETEWRRRPRAGWRPGQVPVDTALLYASTACRWARLRPYVKTGENRRRIAMVNFKIVEL